MLRCRDLMALPTMSRAKLLAGEKGLENGIRWSYKAEGMNFASWVHGEELLVVSTSVINSVDFNLHELIEQAIRLNLSGVLLLIGEEYISSISMRTISLANRYCMPMISLPGDIPLVDVFEELGHAIVFQEKKQLLNDDILAGIFFDGKVDSFILNSQAEILGYNIDGKQRGFMIHIVAVNAATIQDSMSRYTEELQKQFKNHKSTAIISHFHTNLIGITGEPDTQKIDRIFKDFLTNMLEKEATFMCQIAVGSAYDKLTLLSQSFSEASSVLKLATPVQWYERLGFLKILLNNENQKPLLDYVEQILGKVIKHDQENDADLLRTLEVYFQCNENMKETGLRLYIHPNTVKYRLQQIQELSGLSLFLTSEKIELYNALVTMKMVSHPGR